MVVVIADYFLPLMIIAYCYGRIFWTLRQRINWGKNNNVGSSSSTANILKAKINIIKTLLIVVVFFLLCFSYLQILYLLYNFGYEVNWNGAQAELSTIMVFLNCTVNPYIYLVNYKDFQNALMGLLRCNRLHGDTGTSQPHAVVSSVTLRENKLLGEPAESVGAEG